MALRFDETKDAENVKAHGISLTRFADMATDSMLFREDDRDDYGERRWAIYGTMTVSCMSPS